LAKLQDPATFGVTVDKFLVALNTNIHHRTIPKRILFASFDMEMVEKSSSQ